MATSPSPRNAAGRLRRQRGFTLIETLVALGVLAVGVTALAALVARMLSTTSRSSYESVAVQLVTEKLEDLNRYPSDDPRVVVATGGTAGSLTSDVIATVSSGGVSEAVAYYDEVRLAVAGGSVSEIESGLDGSGNVVYTTITHQPDGTVSTSVDTSLPDDSGVVRFRRRWVIEGDQPTAGVRRITVRVVLENPVSTPVSFQMSMVRP